MTPPPNAVAAATHPDPYSYYAALRRDRPFAYDDGLGLWVAVGTDAVTEILASDACHTRPPAEPVPSPLLGGAAADVFGRLVRMTDGERHAQARRAVAATLASVSADTLAATARHWAGILAGDAVHGGRSLDAFLFALPMHAVGALLGFAPALLSVVAQHMQAFVTAIGPGATPTDIARGHDAAAAMVALITELMVADDGRGLARTLQNQAHQVGDIDPATVAANAVGFLSQTHDATAGLLGNTILALGARPDLRRKVAADRSLLPAVMQEVLRFDPPGHNTRRFVVRDVEIAGQRLRAGDTVLVVYIAANRDPDLNPDPDRFDPRRTAPRILSFGHGRHACPGTAIAAAIAVAGLDALLDRLPDAGWPAAPTGYRPTVTRIPMFG